MTWQASTLFSGLMSSQAAPALPVRCSSTLLLLKGYFVAACGPRSWSQTTQPDSVSAHFMHARLRTCWQPAVRCTQACKDAGRALSQVFAALIHVVRCSSTCLQDLANVSGSCYLDQRLLAFVAIVMHRGSCAIAGQDAHSPCQ